MPTLLSNSSASADPLDQILEASLEESSPIEEVMAAPESIVIPVESMASTSDSLAEVETDLLSGSSAASAEMETGSSDMLPSGPIFLIGTVGDSSALFGSNEDEFIAGRFGDSVLFGNGGQDTLIGDLEGSGNDKLFAGQGDDEVLGNGGDDIIFGEEGDDSLFGGAGNDFLRGGQGKDNLFGGEGTDIFAVSQGSGTDVVFDFEAPRDIIGLSDGITFGQLTLTQKGRSTVISFNSEDLVIVNNTTATNFTADTFLSV